MQSQMIPDEHSESLAMKQKRKQNHAPVFSVDRHVQALRLAPSSLGTRRIDFAERKVCSHL
jgi:hypothetical protein